jgi:hypothetical protein
MTSLRSHEGYMFIDNRNNSGVDDAVMVALGYPVGAGKGLYESATYTCSHCNAIVIIEPKRTRERGYCRGCSRNICDGCDLVKSKTFECRSMERIIDEVLESAVRQTDTGSTIILSNP